MSTMNISLPEQMKAWVESRSRDGRYANSSDYVRDLIRRDQERTAAIAALQAEVDAGRESGAAAPFDRAGFMARMRGQGG